MALRDAVLRKPLGLRFSAEDSTPKDSLAMSACYREDSLVGRLVCCRKATISACGR